MAVDIGIDLGTASILVYVKGKGVILKEPSVVAFDRDSNEVKAIGEEARLMLGRTPGHIIAVRSFASGSYFRLYCDREDDQVFCSESTGKKNISETTYQYLCAKWCDGS